MPDEPDPVLPPAEPEGGPYAREAAFLSTRLIPAQPEESPPQPLIADAEEPGAEEVVTLAADQVPPDFRTRRLNEFRAIQQPRPAVRDDAGMPLAPVEPPLENWVPIGPSVVRQGQSGAQAATSGRTPGIAVAPGGRRVYIGAANGGVWRSDDAGRTWESMMDGFDLDAVQQGRSDSLSIGAIALDPGDPDRLFVGTGEGAAAMFFGVGPVVTADGGRTWRTEPVAPDSDPLAGSAFYALAVDPKHTNRVVAATHAGLYCREPDSERSADGKPGFQWVQKKKGTGYWRQGPTWTSVVAAASDSGTTFFAAARWTENGVDKGEVYRSFDGDTWVAVGTDFPAGDIGRIGLGVQAGNPMVVYALVEKRSNHHFRGVYRLDIANGNWLGITEATEPRLLPELFGPPNSLVGQGSYDLAIAVDPGNVNRIYLGGSIKASNGDWSASVYRCEVTPSEKSVSLKATYIGNSAHGDIHTLVFTPGDSDQLWMGCDGGVFVNESPITKDDAFESRNTGLATLTVNYVGQHPLEDAVVLAGTQDNGAVRYTGEEAWLYSAGGDCGYAVVNWADPYKMLATYVRGGVRLTTDGGRRYSYTSVDVPLADKEPCEFYAPLTGAPRNPDAPAEADLVAFGSDRPWISSEFGANWKSIPADDRTDALNGTILSLAFASAKTLHVGTRNGGVYRFDHEGGSWRRTRLDTSGAPGPRPPVRPVTAIAVDPWDPTGTSIFIALGAYQDYRHVWRFNGSAWSSASGPVETPITSFFGSISSDGTQSYVASIGFTAGERYGSTGNGIAFDDADATKAAGPLTKLTVRHGDIVDCIQATYGTTVLPAHGGTGGSATDIPIQADDPLVEIWGFTGSWFGREHVLQLSLRTRSGTVHGPFGTRKYASSYRRFRYAVKPSPGRLLDVHTSALVADPSCPGRLFAGADIGVWVTEDHGATWRPYSEGLPDAAVLDLALHKERRLLRASTHGRGVWERRIDSPSAAPVELFVRDTQLDQGRFPTVDDGKLDPTVQNQPVNPSRGPDIKVDGGRLLPKEIDFHQFVDKLADPAGPLSFRRGSPDVTRVFVQVHNRGVKQASDVRVWLLAANATTAIPALPAGFESSILTSPVSFAGWSVSGPVVLNGLKVGVPRIAAFELTADQLPGSLAGTGPRKLCLLALVHHADDRFTNGTSDATRLSLADRKAAFKIYDVELA
ncbi:hypothetical protein KIPE111705_46775 [Kibdelosporangium persicum]|uniref:Jacalin-type lectin domain-containing protein n=1 Tax=Kibdelosporangium persicum TaxID=2698649 RepID=A0ABX2FFH3_9PSEU|nr:hypothetical protein [Kibdelosporangium persicum]NRN69884.1 hypothetical protein [Kibdelosporangium persicum]